jgi:hypothetical protein
MNWLDVEAKPPAVVPVKEVRYSRGDRLPQPGDLQKFYPDQEWRVVNVDRHERTVRLTPVNDAARTNMEWTIKNDAGLAAHHAELDNAGLGQA